MVAVHQVGVHERDFELLALFVVINDHLVEVVVHKIDVRVVIRQDLFLSQYYFGLVLSIPEFVVIDDVTDLADISLC